MSPNTKKILTSAWLWNGLVFGFLAFPALMAGLVALAVVFLVICGISLLLARLTGAVYRKVTEQRRTAARLRNEQVRKLEEQQRLQQEIANQPSDPTPEDRMRFARQRYDSVLGMLAHSGLDATELNAARQQAKQRYMRELDEVMK